MHIKPTLVLSVILLNLKLYNTSNYVLAVLLYGIHSLINCCSYSILDCLDGSKYLDTLGYLEFDVWYNILALFCFNVGFLVLAYVSLRQLKKEK